MPGMPNSEAQGGGRLTLRRVWFDEGGTLNAKVSPYVFHYTYDPPSGQNGYPDRYRDLDGYSQGLDENPAYDPSSVDRWGTYRADGPARQETLNPWVDQAPDPSFDPAAWQLKRIALPSGGEIHVQYEQDDYAHVQDRRAHVMVSITGEPEGGEGRVYVDLDAVGWSDPSSTDRLVRLIEEAYVQGGEKMYFRYLYDLAGNDGASLTGCGSEYVTGYADVEAVGRDAQGVFVELASARGPLGSINPLGSPKGVCLDFVRTQKHGKLGEGGQCTLPDYASGIEETEEKGKASEIVMGLVTMIGTIPPFDTGLFCKSVSAEHSYLRLPSPKPKQGGGLRVKRLLMFDRGVEPGDARLYGRAYHYAMEDPEDGAAISSGVASMEPATGREENALIRFMEREKQGFFSKVVAGKDRKETEGPLGETVFPAPSVGYARVVIRDIHDGATNPGLAVREFYTYHDYPVRTEATGMEKDMDFLPLPLGIYNYVKNELRATQGFSVIDEGMHGQPKRTATYAGDYPAVADSDAAELAAWAADDAAWSLSSEERFQYAEPGEPVALYGGLGQETSDGRPGRQMEVVIASRKTEDVTTDLNVEGDGSIGLWGIIPVPFVTAVPSVGNYESRLFTHATTKQIHYAPTLVAVDELRGGTTARREHASFSPATGEPVVARAFDGYHGLDLERSRNHDGTYRSHVFEAHGTYPAMGSKADTEGLRLESSQEVALHVRALPDGGRELAFDSQDDDACLGATELFTPGDLIEYSKDGTPLGFFNVGEKKGSRIGLYRARRYQQGSLPLKDSVDVRIVRSGRTNQLRASAGGMTSYGEEQAVDREERLLELQQRQRLADALNQLRNTNGVFNGTVSDADVLGNRTYLLDGGSCVSGSNIREVSLDGDANGVKLNVEYGNGSY